MVSLLLKNACVYDPAQEIDGQQMDICIEDGLIKEKCNPEKEIDLQEKAVMPLGVDIHSHILSEETSISPGILGSQYQQMGYGWVNEAAVYESEFEKARIEFESLLNLETTFLLLLGNHPRVLEKISKQEDYVSLIQDLLSRTGAYGIKAVNPGGVYSFKKDQEITSLREEIPEYGITPVDIIRALTETCEKLKLPHPLHLHTINLGRPGNFKSTLECMEFEPLHIAHLQFASYKGDCWEEFSSAAEEISKKLSKKENITADLGQVIYGPTETVTADLSFAHYLAKLQNRKLNVVNKRGQMSYEYKENSPVNSVQWAIGLELALLNSPWQIFISTDSPNGGYFTRYPKIIAWLMDKKHRDSLLQESHPWARKRTQLESIEREYSLYEVAIATRTGPSRRLGSEVSLGIGEPASLAVYDIDPGAEGEEIEKAFSHPEYVISEGEIVDGEFS